MKFQKLPTRNEGTMIVLSLFSFAALGAYNQKFLDGRREDEALMTFMAWVWISSFVMMLGDGFHRLKFCAIGTMVLFSNMPMLSIIGLGWIGAFESMMWLCFEAETQTTTTHSEAKDKKQKRLDFIRKTVITRRINSSKDLCGGNDSCAICLNQFQKRDMVCFSPNSKCTHAFHLSCAEKWLSQHVRCPCCRENYLQKPHGGKKNHLMVAVPPEVDPATSQCPASPCLKQQR